MTEAIEKEPAKMGRPPKLYPVRLLKNHQPGTHRYEVAGYWKPEYYRHSPDGKGKELVPEEWIAGEEAPPPYPGVGTKSKKLWAGTVVKFEATEANRLTKLKLAEAVHEYGED